MKYDTYIIEDRTTGTCYALEINNKRLRYTSSSETAQDEPIVQDKNDSSKNWRIFIDNGLLAVEEVVTVQDDEIDLYDTEGELYYRLAVYDGTLGFYEPFQWFDYLTNFIPATSWTEQSTPSDSWTEQAAPSDSWAEMY